ncbi:MAG TPA: TauD/TfdA family dioxygenase [Acetobacteraceae bacterium]|nr:TauD/TfdA family dioxygenase [Acetobacteraceae bacterium]
MSAAAASVLSGAGSMPLRRPVEGASVWTASDLRGREAEWSYRLSAAEIAELETARQAAQVRGLDIAAMRREDFPLPTLGPVLERLRDDVLHGRGFVLLRGVPVENRPIEESATIYWGIGTYFGSARSQNAKGHLLGHVYDLGGSSATDPNTRSYATNERQNFHIDRCDVVALLCLRRAKSGGLSAIASSMAIHNAMLARRPDLLERLYQPLPVDRRGEVPEGKAPFYEAPVFNECDGQLSVLYSRLHIGSSQRFPETRRLTPDDIAALDMLGDLAADDELRLDMAFMPGDIQFLHNHTILHARTGYEDWPEQERKRHLLRLWLAPPGARALPPVFAECYGGITPGDRGGIICKDTRLHAPLVPA